MGLDETKLSASRRTLANYGNMSSPTILFIIEEILYSNTRELYGPRDGYWLVFGFGPGLHAEILLLELTE
jgi:predicted naringenin-chalcone synthase